MGTTNAPTASHHLLLLPTPANDSWQGVERQFFGMEQWRNLIPTPMPARALLRWHFGIPDILADIRTQRYTRTNLDAIILFDFPSKPHGALL